MLVLGHTWFVIVRVRLEVSRILAALVRFVVVGIGLEVTGFFAFVRFVVVSICLEVAGIFALAPAR